MFDLKQLFSARKITKNGSEKRQARKVFQQFPDCVYAIGDVHGCMDLLVALEQKIFKDSASCSGEATIIMLGDYVDRGPQSAAVLDHLISPPQNGITRHCIMGNHEAMMLSFLNTLTGAQYNWLDVGGYETMMSYGFAPEELSTGIIPAKLAQKLGAHMPDEHRAFLMQLPLMIEYPEHVFVHAGIRPGIPLNDQVEQDLLWIRSEFLAFEGPFEKYVVHGHTPVAQAEKKSWRANADTGAYATGNLSAIKFVDGKPEDILCT